MNAWHPSECVCPSCKDPKVAAEPVILSRAIDPAAVRAVEAWEAVKKHGIAVGPVFRSQDDATVVWEACPEMTRACYSTHPTDPITAVLDVKRQIEEREA